MGSPPPASPYRTLLRKEESYAIHALIYAAEHPGAPTAKIAHDLHMPPAFLAKVLRRLAQAGYVENRQGRGGGVRLLVDPATVSLLDVIETMSGPLIVDGCQAKTVCPMTQRKGYCHLNAAWVRSSIAIRGALANVLLSQVIDPPHGAAVPPAGAADGPGAADAGA